MYSLETMSNTCTREKVTQKCFFPIEFLVSTLLYHMQLSRHSIRVHTHSNSIYGLVGFTVKCTLYECMYNVHTIKLVFVLLLLFSLYSLTDSIWASETEMSFLFDTVERIQTVRNGAALHVLNIVECAFPCVFHGTSGTAAISNQKIRCV